MAALSERLCSVENQLEAIKLEVEALRRASFEAIEWRRAWCDYWAACYDTLAEQLEYMAQACERMAAAFRASGEAEWYTELSSFFRR